MPRLPSRDDVDGRAAPRASYNVPDFPRNPVPAALINLGQAVSGMGADFAQAQARAAAEAERRKKLALQTSLLQMEAQWGGYADATEASTSGDPGVDSGGDPGVGGDVSGAGDIDYDAPDPGVYVAPATSEPGSEDAVPADPAGTTTKRVTEFDTNARKFMASVPDEMKPYADASLYKLRTRIEKRAAKYERKESERFYSVNLSNGLDVLLDRLYANPGEWQEVFKQGEDLYDLHPTASPGQKAVWKEKWRTRAGKRLFEANPQYFIDWQKQRQETQQAQPKAEPGAGLDAPSLPAQIVPAKTAGLRGAIKKSAAELGISPVDLATVISYETGGKFSPSIMGGKGGRYIGLIQFGPEERKRYGASADQTPEQQMEAVTRYLKDRGLKPGMGLADLYSTINAGTPGRYKASDRAGYTVARHVKEMANSRHRRNAEKLVGGEEVQVASNDPTIGITQAEPQAEPVGNGANYGILGDNIHPALQSIPYEERVKMAKDVAISYTNAIESDVASIKETGVPVVANPNSILSAMDPAKARKWMRDRELALRHYEAVTDMQSMSEAEIAQRIEMERPTPGSPSFADEEANFNGLVTEGNSIVALRDKDPAAAADKAFPEVAALKAAFDPAKPETLGALVDARIEAQKRIGIATEKRAPLTKAESRSIAELMDSSPDAAMKLAYDLTENVPEQASDILAQVADDAPGLAAAAEFIVKGGEPDTLRYLAEQRELTRDKNFKEPSRDSVDVAKINHEAYGTAFLALPQRRSTLEGSAWQIFQAMARRRGMMPDIKSEDGQKLYREALNVAAGGYSKNGEQYGGIVKVNGFSTLAPIGMKASEVKDRLRSISEADLAKLPPIKSAMPEFPVKAEDIAEGYLVAVGDGIYRVALDDPTGTAPRYVMGADGGFWYLDMNLLAQKQIIPRRTEYMPRSPRAPVTRP